MQTFDPAQQFRRRQAHLEALARGAPAGVVTLEMAQGPEGVSAADGTESSVTCLAPTLPWLPEHDRVTATDVAALDPLPVRAHIEHGLEAAPLAALFDAEFREGEYPADLLAFSVAVLRLVRGEVARRRGHEVPEYAQLDADVRRRYPAALAAAHARFLPSAPGVPADARQYLARTEANDVVMSSLSLAAGAVEDVLLAAVRVASERRRRADLAHVAELAESIAAIGLNQPIVVTPTGELVAGLHRLLAHERLGRQSILAFVRDFDGQNKRLAEIDENLVRRQLPALELAELTLERQGLYETLHPETRQHFRGGHVKAARKKNDDPATAFGAVAASFSKDTAQKTGLSDRTIRQYAQVAKMSVAAKSLVRDTPLASRINELVALSRLPAVEQAAVAQLIASKKAARVSAARDALRATRGGAVPCAVTQSKPMATQLAALGRLRNQVEASLREWQEARDPTMAPYVECWGNILLALDDALVGAKGLALPDPCPCGTKQNCSQCAGRGWMPALK